MLEAEQNRLNGVEASDALCTALSNTTAVAAAARESQFIPAAFLLYEPAALGVLQGLVADAEPSGFGGMVNRLQQEQAQVP